MTKSIMIVGTGGQGTLLASRILGNTLLSEGFDVKVSEVHGMSQRGGSVVTYVKYGEAVYSPIIGKGEADIILAFEQLEAYRALPYLKKGGSIITDEREIYSVPVLTGACAYPHDSLERLRAVVPRLMVIRAAEKAEALGNIKAQNIVLLGALVRAMGLEQADWHALIAQMVPPKAVAMNLAAYDAGYDME